MLGVAVVGYGYWGPNLVRNFSEEAGCQVVVVSDVNHDRLAAVRARYPAVEVTPAFGALLDDNRIDAVAIATPVSTHFDLSLRALRAGKHVLVEKPLATSAEQVTVLMEEAERRNLVLMVDHTFLYTGAVRKIRELVSGGELGEVYYYDSVRVSLGLFQHDVNVIWDLAVHDLSIIDYILPDAPTAVSAIAMSHVPGEPENIAYLTLFYQSRLIAHVHVNWLAPVKVRRTLIGGSRRMIMYDELDPSEKVKVYDSGITVDNAEGVYQMLVGYRTGDMWAPRLDRTEALRAETSHFRDCIENGRQPLSDGHSGLRVVHILEAAVRSVAQRGQPVELNPEMLAK